MDLITRLTALRKLMASIGADYYLVPAADPHKNEYVPDHWQRRQWISNFTGSAGDALIGLKTAYLWTDPRYFLQAETELDPKHFELIKMSQSGAPQLEQWLLQQDDKFCLAIDPTVISIAQLERIRIATKSKHGKLLLLEENLIDKIWEDQPPLPTAEIRLFDLHSAGVTLQEKVAIVRQKLQQNNSDALVLNTLDAIAWLFNIRGDDIRYNPLVISYAILTEESALLFVDETKLNETIKNYFSQNHITVLALQQFSAALKKLQGCVWLDPNSCNAWIQNQLSHTTLFYSASPILHLKAIKNSTELRGMRQAHILDAIAMIKFFYWLENNWQKGITELSAAETLNAFRLEHPDCLDLSFNTISGFAAHGAIVHYAVTPESNISINDSALYLVDSGGQYTTGTTDITRTLHLGQPTSTEKHHYTLVLKGHLGIRQLIFPQGTCGEHINAFAHAPLWREALDYGHGTGHGVGCYSCVHEFPPVISARQMNEPFKPGMIVSNEPGLYLTDHYGIRIENLCEIVEQYSIQQSATQHGPFYGFEDLTLVPYARNLIAKESLTHMEIEAVNRYHEKIFATLQPLLTDTALISWLRKNTAPL